MARILVVDDDELTRNFLRDFLSRKKHEVETAPDGLAALQRVKENQPDIVLLDIMMQGLGGIEVLKEIRKIDPRIGVIMTTGLLDEEIAKRTLELGAYDYIIKPFDLQYLERVLGVKLIDLPGDLEKKV